MFKKDVLLTSNYDLSNKERKDIIKKLKTNSSLNKDIIKYILKNLTEMTCDKTNNKKRIISYKGNPILFEYDKELFYPTVYLLNMFPTLVNKVALIYDETDTYLDNGADLMMKGVINKDQFKQQTFKLGEIMAIQTVKG